ncbi:NAD-dependent epimerase/dehydratase family protein [Stieleria varia]|uniref:dTDP-glucose 4,6-dehydratase n=1 Tax=Stieleria varia TaxID=2528005 RepID=A0A5C6AXD2_9BACT|nr:NAD(P)-dependent oxidoreductase [Stieleria varia]TWU04390.1 dTDP-glucose 4,6-dehydratase [Stieleria varia]
MLVSLTGGTGFLGRYLIERFITAGYEVRAWCRCLPDEDHLDPRVHWIQGTLKDDESAERLLAKSDAVVHSAVHRSTDSFIADVDDPQHYFDLNVGGSLKLLETAARQRVGRFVFISSGAVHDQILSDRPLDETHPLWPKSFYGACKAATEALIHHYGMSGKLQTCSLRPTAIYAVAQPTEQSKWYELITQVVSERDVDVSGGSKEVHASDVAKAAHLLLTTDRPIAGESFNCCDRMISHHEVASIAKRLTGSHSQIHGDRKEAKHQIDTSKIRSLGMEFGGTPLLEQTIQTLVDSLRA